MAYRTFGDLATQVRAELDLDTEDFIQPSELTNYFNSGIRIIEANIIQQNSRDKYLQDEAFISTVAAQEDYTLPSDIIDTKIRKLVFRDGATIYTMRPLISEDSYEVEDVERFYSGSTTYFHWSIYKTSEDYVLRLTPEPTKSVTDAIRVVYFKDLNRYLTDATNCDIPEICYEWLLSYVRFRCYQKELHPNMQVEAGTLEKLQTLMDTTLMGQAADPELHGMEGDTTHYEESN